MPAPRIDRTVPRGKRKPDTRVSKTHRVFLRSLPCVVADRGGCTGMVAVAHVRNGSDGGQGLTPSDRYGLPLCTHHHLHIQHQKGEITFWRNTEIAVGLAEELYRHSGDYDRALRAIDRARMEMRRIDMARRAAE